MTDMPSTVREGEDACSSSGFLQDGQDGGNAMADRFARAGPDLGETRVSTVEVHRSTDAVTLLTERGSARLGSAKRTKVSTRAPVAKTARKQICSN